MSATLTQTSLSIALEGPAGSPQMRPALVIVWSRVEPHRVGEIFLPPAVGAPAFIGRTLGPDEEGRIHQESYRQRPGRLEGRGALSAPRISRTQLRILARPEGRLEVENLGRCALLLDGAPVQRVTLRPGQMLTLEHELLLLCAERPAVLPPLDDAPQPLHAFGGPDDDGMVGECPLTWALRREVAFVGGRPAHVLIRGASGTGKELVAGALHRHSSRARRPMVSRNAATFPEGLIAAELFGNAKSFPNVGMPERPGLIGEADGSSLFLDEIGELPPALQANLLRVLDQGEYQRLGESTQRHADVRLIAATHREEAALKHDLLARLKLRVVLPDLNVRREDIPLLARHLMRQIAAEDATVDGRFMASGVEGPEPRFTAPLVADLLSHTYTTHIRELEMLLWRAMAASRGNALELPEEGLLPPKAPGPAAGEPPVAQAPARERAPPGDAPALARGEPGGEGPSALALSRRLIAALDPGEVQARINHHEGTLERVWPELGLPNRFALYRFIKKHGLSVPRPGGDPPGRG